eukprot:TRINITY_DN643_c0_g1_i1.p1 TRINITY_DN643_c0_g1~~TRINITY_DN643_c0_g1_i1.p1  ORF type:complete len:104 (+),score=44.61 TRINITY_DN643_c0_g1_i1:74-385(+)
MASKGTTGGGTGDKYTAIQDEIDKTKGVLKSNIDKAIARGDKLDQLGDKASTLNDKAARFEKGAATTRRQMCLQKWRNIFLVILVLIIIIIIVVAALGGFKKQ